MNIEPRCGICKAIVAEYKKDGSSKLERRLLNCRKFNPNGAETQQQICDDTGFSNVSMSKHLKYHQNPNEEIAIKNKMERNMTTVTSKYQTVQDTIMDVGLEGIKSGETKVPASVIASVARDKMNQEEKNKDRGLKLAEMVFAFASGEQNAGGLLTAEPSRDVIEGTE